MEGDYEISIPPKSVTPDGYSVIVPTPPAGNKVAWKKLFRGICTLSLCGVLSLLFLL